MTRQDGKERRLIVLVVPVFSWAWGATRPNSKHGATGRETRRS